MITNCFDAGFQGSASYLKNFAMKLTKDIHLAEDLFQETAFLAFKNKEKFELGTNQRAWLSTIMRNLFINQYRRNKKKALVFDYSNEEFLLNSKQEIEYNEGESNVTLEELDSLVTGLTTNLKQPFTMAIEGFKYEEIAETMDLPLGTVKSRIFMARKALQKKMQQLYPEVSKVSC